VTGALSADELFRKHADELLAFATGLVGPSDAADIVSAAFVAALSGRNWEMVDNRRAYLYRCVQNEARRLYRSRSRRAVRERRAAAPHSVEDRDPRPDVVAAVRNLSFRQKGVVFLTYWTGMTPPEVAAALGIGEGSVRRHLARARARLREVLDE
jgi:RNA polymerase sigma factor (sigma-70 family)